MRILRQSLMKVFRSSNGLRRVVGRPDPRHSVYLKVLIEDIYFSNLAEDLDGEGANEDHPRFKEGRELLAVFNDKPGIHCCLGPECCRDEEHTHKRACDALLSPLEHLTIPA